jgi:hypothetical protein
VGGRGREYHASARRALHAPHTNLRHELVLRDVDEELLVLEELKEVRWCRRLELLGGQGEERGEAGGRDKGPACSSWQQQAVPAPSASLTSRAIELNLPWYTTMHLRAPMSASKLRILRGGGSSRFGEANGVTKSFALLPGAATHGVASFVPMSPSGKCTQMRSASLVARATARPAFERSGRPSGSQNWDREKHVAEKRTGRESDDGSRVEKPTVAIPSHAP